MPQPDFFDCITFLTGRVCHQVVELEKQRAEKQVLLEKLIARNDAMTSELDLLALDKDMEEVRILP